MKSSPIDSARILVVDDDPRIRQMLQSYFEQQGYSVGTADDGAQMRAELDAGGFDIILLDVVMPGEDGLSLASEIRAKSDIGIIMLTGRDEVMDRVVGLEVGADDYIAKPFHLREVLARVKSVLRRKEPLARPLASERESIGFDGWRLDTSRRQLFSSKGREVALTTGEFDLLAALVGRPGHVFSREALMELTRGRSLEAFDRVIDAQVARLRKKIEVDLKSPRLIKSVRGVGYVFAGKIER